MRKEIFFVFFIPLAFFIISLLTLKDYGISWDEPLHFNRGQAYFHYLTTGKTNYSDITGRKSYFQNSSQNGAYFLQNDSAHPPANDILAAFFNYVFYQKLGWMGDIESLHLFNIVVSSVLVFIVCIFAYEVMGFLPAIVSGLVVSTYPLLFAEGHFNIKDPAETAFFTLCIYFFWKSLKKFDWKYLLAFGLSAGLSLGTKFNIVFLPLILVPFLVVRYWKHFPKAPKTYYVFFILSPIIALAVFYLLWPYLWSDPIANVIAAVKYYQEIGTGQIAYQGKYFLLGGFNLYPISWILITTPPLALILMAVGIIWVLIKKTEEKHTPILWLLWFVVPILRVSVPGTSIYGGVRQIMEFIPAMALLAGLGAGWLFNKFNKYFAFFLIALFAFPIIVLIRLHPNENVYFNFLAGGLSGAKEKNVPYWGNSFGNAYLQAVNWINENAESGARLALVQGTISNIPKIWVRKDIKFFNSHWSGIDRKGEYLVELTHDDPVRVYPYVWGYIEKFLKPVYEVKVDGVAIAKVWKNDLANTYPNYQKRETLVTTEKYKVLKERNKISVLFDMPLEVTRIKNVFTRNFGCSNPKGYVEEFKGGVWQKFPEDFPAIQMEKANNKNDFSYFFLGEKVSAIKFTFSDFDSCGLNSSKISVYALE